MSFNKVELENNKELRLTIDELRKFEEFEKISDLEANQIIDSLYRLAVITYNLQA